MQPQVSVIIPTYNRGKFLIEALESVFLQVDAPPFEVIVVDDGSQDNTAELLAGYKEKIRYIKITNSGVSSARNVGVSMSIAPWLAFLDSDDLWYPEKLSKQYQLAMSSSYKIIHCNEVWQRNGILKSQKKKHQKFGGDIFESCLELCLISPSAIFLRKELFLSYGGFREDFPVCEDYDLWLKLTHDHQVGFIDEPLLTKRGGHDDQLSNRYHSMDYYRVLSLYWLFERGVKEVYRKAFKKVLSRKCEILLNGYTKHCNMKHYQQIFDIYQKVLKERIYETIGSRNKTSKQSHFRASV